MYVAKKKNKYELWRVIRAKRDFICILAQIKKFSLYMGENKKEEEMNKLSTTYQLTSKPTKVWEVLHKAKQ